jgi:hypothetical protein
MLENKESKISTYFWIIIGLLALGFKIFLLFYTYWHRHYLVPPGGDVIGHYQIIQHIIQTKTISFRIYPEGFHLLVVAISKIFHQSIWGVLTNWTPVLIILPALAIFFLLRQLFSLRVSVISASILLLTSNYPLLAFIDGNYPDMLAYGCFGVLAFAFLIRYFRTDKRINLLWAGIFLILIALTHHFTFFSIFAILLIFGLWQLLLKISHAKISLLKKICFSLGSIILLMAVGYLIVFKMYGGMVLPYLHSLITNTPTKNSIINSWAVAPQYSDYPDMAGNLVWYFGLAGFFYVLATNFADKKHAKFRPLLIIWPLFFYLMSRFEAANFLPRFARELALPLTVFMAYLFDYLIEKNMNRKRLGQILAFGLIGYLIIINSSLYTGLDQIPDSLGQHVFYSELDQGKIDWMSANIPKQTTILYNPWGNWFFPVRTENMVTPMVLKSDKISIVNQYIANPKNLTAKAQYDVLVDQEKNQFSNIEYIFDDMPPVNMDPSWYHNYTQNHAVLQSMETNYQLVKTFEDGAKIYQKQ